MPVEVKICGLSTEATLEGAIAAGADYVGLVFYRLSPRNVDHEKARILAERARGRAKIVALVVDAPASLIESIAGTVRPDYFQAHGDETEIAVKEITKATGVPVIKAIKVRSEADLQSARSFGSAAEMLLFDAKIPDGTTDALPGGNGLAFDWSILSRGRAPLRFMLSGGLNPGNVQDAIRITAAPIVDVSSGVESSPGIKDLARINAFIKAVRQES